MYSMNYLGRVFNNVKEFYNEINGATLTGAIDVVVVEQADGSFTCSPFHVRFGKLGVLRSRFKVVDLELNGEQLNIQMKLGESGEAFFVEEVPEDEVESSAHLATSPIPDNGFTLYQEQNFPARRNSADFSLDKYQNQISDFTQRRYTDGHGTQKSVAVQKRDYKIAKDKQIEKNPTQSSQEQDLFLMDDVHDVTSEKKVEDAKIGAVTAKMFRAEEVNDKESRAKDVVRKISINNDFKSIANDETLQQDVSDGKAAIEETSLQSHVEEAQKPLNNGNNKKKKKTKKSGSKKKNAQRKSSTSSNGYSSQSETVGAEIVETEKLSDKYHADAICDKELIENSFNTNSFAMKNLMQDVHFFSDTDIINSDLRRGKGSRSGTPVQSDSELELARGSGVEGSCEPGQSWRWGELPSPLPMTKSAVSLSHPPVSDSISSDDEHVKTVKTTKAYDTPTTNTSQTGSSSMLSGMFNFMKHPRGGTQSTGGTGGVYLAELEAGAIEPEVAALYFPSHVQGASGNSQQNVPRSLPVDISNTMATEEDYESGNGPSLPQSPSSVEGIMGKGVDSDEDDIKIFCKGYVGLSLCGPSCLDQPAPAVSEAFEQDSVRFETLCTDPSLLQDPRLVVRIGEKYMPWAAAAPALLSLIVYHRPLPKNTLKSLVESEVSCEGKTDENAQGTDSKSQQWSGGFTWWNWRRSADKQTRNDSSNKPGIDAIDGKQVDSNQETPAISVETETEEISTIEPSDLNDPKTQEIDIARESIAVSTQTSFPSLSGATGEGYSGSQSSEESDEGITDKGAGIADSTSQGKSSTKNSDRFRKTLRLSSDLIASLNLREGMNEMVFSVTTAYQGTSKCKCHVFRWRYDDKIVISDIDGTITKSDVLGHIFPLVGKDWAQSGVAQLFTKIKNNGYKLLYLSARAIGQAKVTREYLRSIKQGDLSLPDGPLLLNPTSLLRAFHREVIEKKPEEFKIQCLSDIMALFPEGSKPFYAGYGNRVNDVCAYQTVGIPIVRIFTINYKGELKHELTQTFQSSYSNMSYIVDHLFPPVRADVCEDFSQFVYWRQPIADLNEILPPSVSSHTLPPIPEGSSD